jgi:methylenetetrahydrofolate reductase (NADPH)
VLCLTGYYMTLGDHPESKPVFDLDSVTLLKAAVGLREGLDMAGNDLEGSPDYCLGAVVTPAADPIGPQIMKMEKKVAAGAQFFQTQAVYDAKQFEQFIDQVKHLNVSIMLGIVLLKSAGMARFMNKNVAGVTVPEELVEEMDQARDRKQKSIEIAARLIRETKDLCQGVHFMPLGWETLVPAIMEEAGLLEPAEVSVSQA